MNNLEEQVKELEYKIQEAGGSFFAPYETKLLEELLKQIKELNDKKPTKHRYKRKNN